MENLCSGNLIKKVMEANQILQSNILDILFDGKNKMYGAYDLRKTYNRRASTALFSTLGLIIVFVIVYATNNSFKKDDAPMVLKTPETIVQVLPREKIKPLLPEVMKSVAKATVIKSTIPVVVKDDRVLIPPPDKSEIEKAIIGVENISGNGDPEIINPPSEIKGSGLGSNINSRGNLHDSSFMPIEIEAQFPGGPLAWQRFIQKAINMQLDEFTEGDYGSCTIEFTVDTKGNVSNVHALDNKGTKLATIAVNAVRKGPKWTPAQQNGRYVTALRLQPVTLLNPDN